MRNLISLLLLGLFLSGCYTSSLVYVGPAATGVAQGRTAESMISASVNYVVKKFSPIKEAALTAFSFFCFKIC